MYIRTGISESFYCVNNFGFSASLCKMYGVKIDNKKRDTEKTDYNEF